MEPNGFDKSADASRLHQASQIAAITNAIKNMKWSLHPLRALKIIEGLSIECDSTAPQDAQKILEDIYVVSHAGGNPSCQKHHPDFTQKAIEIEANLVACGLISEWENNEVN